MIAVTGELIVVADGNALLILRQSPAQPGRDDE